MVRISRFISLLLLVIIHCSRGWAAVPDTMTGIFRPEFKTLRVVTNDMLMQPAVLMLGSDDHLTVSFDELAEDRSYMRYRLVHCDSQWRPSQIVDSEFVDGFNEGVVDDYDYSRGTATHYVNYRITIPNDDFRLRLSGNYLLQVYPEDDPDEVILQARFMVAEGAVGIKGEASSRTDVDYRDAHQQLELEIDTSRFPVRDIYNDLFVVVVQNGRMDNAVGLRQPMRVSGKTAYFAHQRSLIFAAGNEYRRMETVSLTYPTMGVERIAYYFPYYHHQLITDTPRADLRYTYDQTQRGRFVVREYNSDRSDVEADYTVVHFALEMPRIADTEVLLDGDFTCRRFDADSRMTYDEPSQSYRKDLLLKQGAYNYQYLALPRGAASALTSTIEGDKYQTVNEYLVLVYTRVSGERYDRLLGATIILADH